MRIFSGNNEFGSHELFLGGGVLTSAHGDSLTLHRAGRATSDPSRNRPRARQVSLAAVFFFSFFLPPLPPTQQHTHGWDAVCIDVHMYSAAPSVQPLFLLAALLCFGRSHRQDDDYYTAYAAWNRRIKTKCPSSSLCVPAGTLEACVNMLDKWSLDGVGSSTGACRHSSTPDARGGVCLGEKRKMKKKNPPKDGQR